MGLSDADIGLGAPAPGLSDADIGLAPQGVLSNSADDGYLSSAAKAIPTALRNAGNMIAGRFGDTANFGDYLAARLTSAVTGRSMDEVRDRTAKAQAAGSAESPLGWAGAHLTGQKLVPSSQTFADLENPYTGEYQPTSEGGRMAMTGAEMALSGPGGAAGKVATVPGAVQRAFTGAGTLAEQAVARRAMAPGMALSGAASQYTTDVTGSPIAGVIAGAAIPAAGAKVVDAGKSLLATSSKRPGMVADKLNAAAEDPTKFQADLNANPDEIIPGAKLTTGQQTGDLGILNAERQARTRDEGFGQQFKHREEQQNIAHGEALDAQAPETTSKMAPSQLFQQHLDELDQQTQQTLDRMTAGRDQLHDQIPEAQPPEQVGANIRDPLQTARNASSQIQDELYRRVDPDGTFHVATDPLHEGAAQIRAGVDPLLTPMSADEVRIHGQIDDHAGAPTIPFNSVRALEQNINEALRNAEPGSRAEGRLQQLKTIVRSARDEAIDNRHASEQSAVGRGTMDPEQTMEARLRAQWGVNNVVNGRAAQGAGQGAGVLPRGTPPANAGAVGAEDAAVGRLPTPAGDSGVPQNPAVPQTTTEPADRLNVANQSYAAHKQTYGTGATGQILARKNQVGYTTSDAGVPAKAFAKGDKGYEAVRSVVEASNNHPQVIQGLQDAAVNRLQAEMVKNNGQLTPKMLAKWKADHAQALRGIDEVAPGFSRQFDNAAAAQDLVDRATAGREAALKAYNRSEAGKLVGKTSEQEVENHLGNILGDGGKGASRMQELVTAARGNLAALDGLKRATVDWLLRKKANNAEVGTSGAKSLSSAGVQGLVKNSEAQLRTLFGDAGYANLQKVAQSMAAKDRSTTATNIAGSPNTARDLGHLLDKAGGGNHETALALIASHVMEHGVSVAHLANAAMLGVPAMVISKMRAKGIHSVEEMYKDALLNPERARFYLSQAGSKTSPVWHSLARSLGAAPTQANINDHNRDPSTSGPHVANFAEGGLVSINNWHGALPPEAGGPPRKKLAPPPPLPPASDLATITPDQILASIHANPHGPVAPAASSIDELLQRDGISAPQSKPRWYVAPDQRLSTNIENREGDGYFNPIAPPPTSFFGVPRNGTPPIMGKPGNWNQILPDRFTPMQGPIDHYAEGGAVEPSYTDPMGNVAYTDQSARVDPNQNVPDGPTMKAYEPSITERVAQWMMGNDRASPERARFVGGLMGTTGLNPKGVGVIDAVPGLGQLANFEGAAHEGDYKQAAIGLIPGAAPLAGEAKAAARALANVSHIATSEGQTGARYVTKQDGPFYRVEKAPGAGEVGRGDQAPEGALGGDGVRSTDAGAAGQPRYADAQPSSAQPSASPVVDPRAVASDYMQKVHGTDLVEPEFSSVKPDKMLPSSLAKQSAIGRAHMLAVEGSPAYKEAVFKAYQQQHPEMVAQSGATNYDELLQASYRQMAHETSDQFEHLPLKFSFHKGEGEYPNSKAMVQDVRDNGHLNVYQGGDRHDFLNQIDPETGLNENEKFRAVHDAFGHAVFGNPFGAQGEEKAWATHQQMYSPLARPAMSAETRGQNSLVNYTPLNASLMADAAELERAAATAKRVGDMEAYQHALDEKAQLMRTRFQYAPQKAVLLPPEMIDPNYRGGMPDYVQKLVRPDRGTTMSSRLTHFSNDPDLAKTDPSMYGTGIKGDEASRLKSSGAVKDRSYFYLGDHRDVTPEEGLGEHAYTTTSHGLYDLTKDPLNFKTLAREHNRYKWLGDMNPGVVEQGPAMNDMERLAKEYGYEGVANPNAAFPMAAVFKPKPVTWQGSTRQTVDQPRRLAYSGIYDNPRLLAQEAESRVAPESPNLKRLFGVTRDDLYQMGANRVGNMEPQLPLNPNAKVPGPVQNVMTPRNSGRMMDALDEFSRQPGLRTGMMPWYMMDPAYHRLVQLVGPEEAAQRYSKFNTMMSMASPGSEVTSEINRGLAAHWLHHQGRFDDFERFGGLGEGKRGKSFPDDMRRIVGHPYHSTSQAGPMSRYLQSGEVNMSSAKVPLYMQSSSVPELGFQTSLPVPDGHFTRGTGLSDTRTAKDFSAAMDMREYNHFGPWFRDQVATPLEMQSVPAQALLWGGYSKATGVETPIGAPKLELLADHMARSSRALGMTPEAARDHILLGKGFARGGLAQAMGM